MVILKSIEQTGNSNECCLIESDMKLIQFPNCKFEEEMADAFSRSLFPPLLESSSDLMIKCFEG